MASTAHQLFAVRPRPAALLDITIATAALAASLAQLTHGIGEVRPQSGLSGLDDLDLVGVVLAVCSTLPLLAWRRFPLGVFTVAAAATVLLAVLGHPRDLMLGPVAALYLLAASRARWTWRTTVLVIGLLAAYLGAAGAVQDAFPGTVLFHSGLAWAVAWFAGERTRLRHEHIAELHDRTRRVEREAERERLLTAAEERARIARDLHDSAGHAISVIVVRAGAARLRHHENPDRSLAALEAIEELARRTVEEIDQIVGTLREGGSPNGATSLASLDTLIAHHAAAGLTVTLDRSGAPRNPGDTADRTAYRILQEGLTNAARHGTGSAHVDLAYGGTALELTVTNPVPTNGAARPGGGHGVIGMRERAALAGGDLHAEREGRTFRLHARIPYGGYLA